MVEVGKRRSSDSATVSATVSDGNSAASWKLRTRPSAARCSGRRRVTSRPFTSTVPPSAAVNPPRISNSVRLAGTVRADQPDDRSPLDLEVDLIDSDHPTELLAQALRPEHGRGRLNAVDRSA